MYASRDVHVALCRYMVCGMTFLGPTLLNLLIAPRVAKPLARVPHAACARYKDWERGVIARCGPRGGPLLAAAGKVRAATGACAPPPGAL